jgi:chromosomal replication initiator protein
MKLSANELRQRGLEDLAADVCARHHVTLNELRGSLRTKPVADARRAFWFVLTDECGWSYSATAKLFNADHSTVMYGVKKYRAECGLTKRKGKGSRR